MPTFLTIYPVTVLQIPLREKFLWPQTQEEVSFLSFLIRKLQPGVGFHNVSVTGATRWRCFELVLYWFAVECTAKTLQLSER